MWGAFFYLERGKADKISSIINMGLKGHQDILVKVPREELEIQIGSLQIQIGIQKKVLSSSNFSHHTSG